MVLSDNIRCVLDQKGWGVLSVAPEAFVYDAVREMADRDIGALAVIGAAGLIGVLSERDCVRGIILPGRPPRDTTVGEVMSHPARTVTPDDTVDDCLRTLTIFRLRHLAVVNNGRPAGMVSVGDLVNWIVSDGRDIAHHTGNRIDQYGHKYAVPATVRTDTNSAPGQEPSGINIQLI